MTREWFYSLVLGVIGVVGGSWLAHTALHTDPLSEKLVLAGVVIAVLGGLLINPTPGKASPLLVAMKGAVVVVSPLIPWVKDRRKSVEIPRIPTPPGGEEGPSGG